jgi:exosortase J
VSSQVAQQDIPEAILAIHLDTLSSRPLSRSNMASFPDSEPSLPLVRPVRLSSQQFAALATVLAVLGLSTIWLTLFSLWSLWIHDALKSIGMVIPLVSLVLILRVWRTLGWRAEGTWWGLPLLLVAATVTRIQQQASLILVVTPHWSTVLPPPSLILLAYASGVVLLLGGVRLYRAALFPILLLYLANPIPHVFSSLIDLPLQHASAHVARAFAMHLGHTLTPDHLRLMFTPDFGMFIAPGCDGIRGSITMGFIALIAGYVFRFRHYAHALVVLGAIALGYVFNLLRLCALVLYYAVALHIPSLQDKAEGADYVIGALLFLVATLLLFAVIARLHDGGSPKLLATDAGPEQATFPDHPRRPQYAKLAMMGLVVLLGCASLGRAITLIHASTMSAEDVAVARFPAHLGNYTLVRSWNESDLTGPVIYVWGQYAPADGRGAQIALGVSPIPDWHDPVMCHTVRGQDPLWQGQLTVATAAATPIDFSSAFYNDGVTRHIEASTMCRAGSCSEFTTERTHFGFVYTRLDPTSLLSQNSEFPVRVLLRAETMDLAVPNDAARRQLTDDLRGFLADVRLGDLTRPYSR